MMQIRVLLLNYEYPPLGGGAANATKYFLKELATRDDIRLDLVTSSPDKYSESTFSENIRIYSLDIGKKGKNLQSQSMLDLLRYAWKAYQFAKKLMKSNDYSLVHAFFGVPCGFLGVFLKKPLIISLRGSDVPFYNPKYRTLDRFIFRFLTPWIWRKAQKVIANSKGLKDLAHQVAKNQTIDVIGGAVNAQEFQRVQKKQPDRFRVLYVGRLHQVKGVSYLLQAFQKLNSAKDSELWIVGDGGIRNDLEEQTKLLNISEYVKFWGNLPHEKLPEIYRSSDVYVLPSLSEGMSNTLLEAMASGLPVIVTDTGGTQELVKGNGIIVQKKNSEEIFLALKKMKTNERLCKEFSEKSITIAEDFSWQQFTDKYLNIYNKIK